MMIFNMILNIITETIAGFFKEVGLKLFYTAFRKWKRNRNRHEFTSFQNKP
jgi:hypothetical protein